MQYRNPRVSLGGTGDDEYQLLMPGQNMVRRMRAIADRLPEQSLANGSD
jgi:hypothetical protein